MATNGNIVNKVDGFVYTTAIKRLRTLNKRIKVVPGGTSLLPLW